MRADGKLINPSGQVLDEDWGTIDFGTRRNESASLYDQVIDGLHESHLSELYRDGRIPIHQASIVDKKFGFAPKQGYPKN